MGCIISKKKSPKRNHHLPQPRESSQKPDDSSQSKVGLVEPEKLSSTSLSPEIPEIGDTDEEEEEEDSTPHEEELKREPSSVSKEEAASVWPAWLVSVAGEALLGWTPRRASSFEKLDKVKLVSLFFFLFFRY